MSLEVYVLWFFLLEISPKALSYLSFSLASRLKFMISSFQESLALANKIMKNEIFNEFTSAA